MTSYIIGTYRVPAQVKEYVLDDLLVKFNKESKQFFCHLLFGTLHTIKRDQQGWVPIPSTTIRKEWGNKVQLKELVDSKLVEIKILNSQGDTYSKTGGLSREYRVTELIAWSIVNKYPSSTDNFISTEYYNLINGHKMKVFKRHELTDENRNEIPVLVRNSMLSIESCIINDGLITKHLDKLFSQTIFNGYSDSLYRRYLNDLNCYNRLRETGIKRVDNYLIKYYPSYKMQMTGRIGEQGGGMQSCSREMKQAAFSNIEGIRNYDLKNSQVWGLIQWFEAANLDKSWLVEYLSRDKQEYANQIGVSKDRWKELFLSLIMAAHLPSLNKVNKIDDFLEEEGAILYYLNQELKGDSNKILDSFHKFHELVNPLKIELDKWHNWLIDCQIPLTGFYGRGKHYVINKTGALFCLSDYKNDKQKWTNKNILKRRLSAFFLQGNEAAFIHHLTVLSRVYNYTVINNQYDGLVTIGKIPEEAIERAREDSGLRYAYLKEKPFV